jgi:DNA-binding NarL/FixJ family response regulator
MSGTGTTKGTIKVAIVEDDAWIRENLVNEINETAELNCVGSYASAEEAINQIARDQPDVVLMDINLPKMNGIDCVRKIKAASPSIEVIMLTANEDSDRIFQSLLAGASGYLKKSTPQSQIMDAILQATQGGSPISADVARKVVQHFNKLGKTSGDIEKLTPREKEVLDHLARGAACKEIADALSISYDTVRLHTKGIYKKLHVHSRSEAVSKYLGAR